MYIVMYMTKTYSVAAARSGLPKLLDEVERGAVVEITRRGKTVARLVPSSHPTSTGSSRFRERLDAWQRAHPEPGELDRDFFASLRDRSETGR